MNSTFSLVDGCAITIVPQNIAACKSRLEDPGTVVVRRRTAADNKQISVLIGLDLSAAFDTVDHSLLIERVQLEFGVNDTALDWLRSYLVDRVQFIKMGQHQSDKVALDVGVPRGSVLCPLLFAVYCSPVGDIISSHGVK